MDWDLNDVRHFLAVARTGSTLSASRMLCVNQTTCARRIAALENALGLALFERAANGYRLTASGTALVPYAENISAAAATMLQMASALGRAGQAEIRFSTSDVLAELIAGPAVAAFARIHPGISVIFNADSKAVDLNNMDADVALRAAPIMDDPQLVVRKVMETPWAFYCARSWGVDRKAPTNVAEIALYPLATLEGRPAAMLRGAIADADIRYISNSMKALIEVIKTGECVGALPMLIGDLHPELMRCVVLDIDAGGLWIVFHERLRQAPHVRAFIDHLVTFIETWRLGQGGDRSVGSR